jgi:hypothetical protein
VAHNPCQIRGTSQGIPRIVGGIDSHFDASSLPVVSAIHLTTKTLQERLVIGMSVKLSDGDGHVKRPCIQFSNQTDITVRLPQSYWGFPSRRLHATKAPAASIATMVNAIPHTSFGDSKRNSTSCVPTGISTNRRRLRSPPALRLCTPSRRDKRPRL